ncbi:hypothetical protein L596_014872 [Steinernema carpocapsae]|uniref:RRM domain-containing protein n=1 Tax=Steinernema carpocapsae TaxID=34508 RepID=A0A4V6A2X7_STECR|nr:hypothetical protein L596_014872 [Steinernema carpocapsae]
MSKQMGGNLGGDRSQRSVFVGNISYEVGEEQLRQVFNQVGQVINLRMVHDRDTGKPKGYGFCEFVDIQSAESAIRSLNGYELNGRQLRVDSAAGGDRNVEEVQQLQAQMATQQRQVEEENPHGAECEPSKAPENITRSVASLPPEKMFELMCQMKECVKNNANEAKQMLLSNPQLGYALLQAQVVMRVIDPQVAIGMLHREPPNIRNTPFHLQTQTSPPVHNSPPTNPGPAHPGNAFPPQTAAAVPPHFGAPQQAPLAHYPPVHTVPPSTSAPVAPPPVQQPPPVAPQPEPAPRSSNDEEQNAQLLMQLLQLSEDQIAQLPPEDRQKVLELRNQLRRP